MLFGKQKKRGWVRFLIKNYLCKASRTPYACQALHSSASVLFVRPLAAHSWLWEEIAAILAFRLDDLDCVTSVWSRAATLLFFTSFIEMLYV
jgi:hypothetical protein